MQDNIEKSLKKDLINYIPIKILPAISGFLFIFILTRKLDPLIYGKYAFVLSTSLIFNQLISGWVNSTIIFYFAEFNLKKELKSIIYTIELFIFLLFSIPYLVLIFFGLNNFYLILTSISLLFVQIIFGIQMSFFQAERNLKKQLISSYIQSIIQITGILVLFNLTNITLSNVLFILVLMYLFPILFNFFQEKDEITPPNFNIIIRNWIFIKKMFLYALPLCLWFFSTQFYIGGDRILFEYFHITKEVGGYTAFKDYAIGLSGFITMPILMATHPILMEIWKNNERMNLNHKISKINSLISSNIKILVIVFLIANSFFLIVGKEIMNFLVSTKYEINLYLVYIVLFSVLLSAVSIYVQKGLELNGKTVVLAKSSVIAAILSFFLNYFFLNIFGVMVSGIIVIFVQLIYIILIYSNSHNIIKLNFTAIFFSKIILFIIVSLIMNRIICYSKIDFALELLFLLFNFIAIILSFRTDLLYLFDKKQP